MWSSSAGADRGRAEPRRQPFEPEARRVELLEILARQAPDERAAGVADLDETRALELDSPSRTGVCETPSRSASSRCTSGVPSGSCPADDQLAQRLRDALLVESGRPARCRRAARAEVFTPGLRRCMLGVRDLRFHIATLSHGDHDDRQLADRRRRRRHVHRRDPAARRRPRDDPQGALDAAGLRRRGRRGGRGLAGDAATVDERRPRDDRRHERDARAARRATALVTTAGFRDVLELRRAAHPAHVRPVLAQAGAARAAPAAASRWASAIDADGEVLAPLDADEVRAVAAGCASRRRRVGRRLPAALLPLSRRTRSGSARSCARSCRASRCRSRARSCASSASTSARRRPSSTPTSAR